jgi:predicted nucleic acid-binding protein
MRFWDTSAIVPLLITEPQSEAMRAALAEDPMIVTAAVTPIEITGALWRRRHRGELSVAAHHDAEVAFANLSRRWREVALSVLVTEAALRVLTRHLLRSLDAIQLASAIVAAGNPQHLPFVTLDKRLEAIARAEGFPGLS